MISLLWHDRESAGYTDKLPSDWFAKSQSLVGVTHDVIGPRRGSYQARCDVQVYSQSADLDYRRYQEVNEDQGMFIGVMRIRFATHDRLAISHVQWQEQRTRRFEECSVTVSYEEEEVPSLESVQKKLEHDIQKSLQDTASARRDRLKRADPTPELMPVTTFVYRRNPDVVAEVLVPMASVKTVKVQCHSNGVATIHHILKFTTQLSLLTGAKIRSKMPSRFVQIVTGELTMALSK